MASIDSHYHINSGDIAPDDVRAVTIIKQLAQDLGSETMEASICEHLLTYNGISTAHHFRTAVVENEVITKITQRNFCGLGMGVVNRIRNILFEPGDTCEPLPVCSRRSHTTHA
jgi:hypothetical protein